MQDPAHVESGYASSCSDTESEGSSQGGGYDTPAKPVEPPPYVEPAPSPTVVAEQRMPSWFRRHSPRLARSVTLTEQRASCKPPVVQEAKPRPSQIEYDSLKYKLCAYGLKGRENALNMLCGRPNLDVCIDQLAMWCDILKRTMVDERMVRLLDQYSIARLRPY